MKLSCVHVTAVGASESEGKDVAERLCERVLHWKRNAEGEWIGTDQGDGTELAIVKAEEWDVPDKQATSI